MTDVLRPLRNSISAKILYSDNVSLSKVLNTKIMIDIIIGVLGFSRGPLLSLALSVLNIRSDSGLGNRSDTRSLEHIAHCALAS